MGVPTKRETFPRRRAPDFCLGSKDSRRLGGRSSSRQWCSESYGRRNFYLVYGLRATTLKLTVRRPRLPAPFVSCFAPGLDTLPGLTYVCVELQKAGLRAARTEACDITV